MGSTESAPSSEEESRPTSVNSSSFLYREELVRKLQEIAEARQTDHTNPNNYNSPAESLPGSSSRGPILSLVQSLQLSARPLEVNRRYMDDDSASTSSSSVNDQNSDKNVVEDDGMVKRRSILQSFCVPDKEPYKSSYNNLRQDTKRRCGFDRKSSPASILYAVQRREFCSNWVNKHFVSSNRSCTSGFMSAEQVNLGERFFPNRRRKIDSVRAKTFCVGYINYGNGLMTASQDHKIRLYEKCGSKQRYLLQRVMDVPYVGWSILDVAVSPDGKDIVYSTWNEAMYQCGIDSDEEKWIPLRVEAIESRFALFSIRFNNSGSEIVAGSTDKRLYIYNREYCACVLKLKVHDDDVNAVCFGDVSSNILFSGADDGLVKVWDRRTMGGEFGQARPVGIFAGHRDGITFIDSRGDDRYALSNSKDQTIKVWDIRHFATEDGINSTRESVKQQRWDYRWHCSPQDNMKTKCLAGDCSVLTLRGHSVLHTLVRARFSPDHTGKRYIYTGCGRGNCVVYDLYSEDTKKVFQGHRSVVRDVAWNPSENEIIAASWDGDTSMWRYDERYTGNINPDGGEMGDEDSTDEQYRPLNTKISKRRRRTEADLNEIRRIRRQRR